jgi:hypothetical protein
MGTYPAGTPDAPLLLFFYDEQSGVLTDPTAIQLDITYGGVVGSVPDFAGPYTYQGASSPTVGQVWRVAAGSYRFDWTIPPSAPAGVYVANWAVTYGPNSDVFLGQENQTVTALGATPPASGDIGYWTGSLSYNGLTLNLGAVDATGTAWLLTKVEGMDGAPTSGQVVQRGSDHGGWPSPQYYSARPITLTIRASAPTQAIRDQARALLQQVVPVSDLGTFVYNEPVPKELQVRRSGVIKEQYDNLLEAVFSVILIAPDPRKYSTVMQTASATTPTSAGGLAPPWTPPITLPAQTPPGQIVVTNNGNFETRPTLSITGPATAPAVYDATDGQTISWSGITLASSDTLVIDLDQRTAQLDGMYVAADLASAWFVCEPGQTELQLAGAPGAGATLTATWQDAYI